MNGNNNGNCYKIIIIIINNKCLFIRYGGYLKYARILKRFSFDMVFPLTDLTGALFFFFSASSPTNVLRAYLEKKGVEECKRNLVDGK